MNKLTSFLIDGQQAHRKGGLYYKPQVLLAYNSNQTLAEYHWRFESIHPFQDGNGWGGRLVLFRECLRNDILPFVIDNEHKMFYYRGLSEFKSTPGFLIGTMQSAQDTYEAWVKYFNEELMEGMKYL